MTLRARLLLMTFTLVAACVLAMSAVLGWITWRSLVEDAQSEAVLAATLMARIAAIGEQVPNEFDHLVGDALVVQARLVSDLVAVAEEIGLEPATIDRRLAAIRAWTSIDEIWVTDAEGRLVSSAADSIDSLMFTDDRALTRLEEAIRGGGRGEQDSSTVRRELDRVTMRYGSTRRKGGKGVVMVGRTEAMVRALSARIGVDSAIELILAGGSVDGIWIVNERGQVVASSKAVGAENNPELAREAMRTATAANARTDRHLLAAAPILDQDGLPSGAAVVSLPTVRLDLARAGFLRFGGGTTLAILAAGLLLAALVARRLTKPIAAVTRAAVDVEARRFVPASLDAIAERPDEIGHLGRVFRTMAIDVLGREAELDRLVAERTSELARKNKLLTEATGQMEAELAAARALQAAILPLRFATERTHSISAYMEPATQMGGDFYDVFRIDQSRIALVLADVSGKGVAAAFFMAIARTVLRNHGREGLAPGECLARANRELTRTNPMELFVTVLYAVLNVDTGELLFANGGHLDPHVICATGEVTILPRPGDLPLGMFEDIEFKELRYQLRAGDTVFLLSDGITEAMNGDGDFFGDDALVSTLTHSSGAGPELVTQRVVEAVNGFVQGAPASDDITCLAVQWRGP